MAIAQHGLLHPPITHTITHKHPSAHPALLTLVKRFEPQLMVGRCVEPPVMARPTTPNHPRAVARKRSMNRITI